MEKKYGFGLGTPVKVISSGYKYSFQVGIVYECDSISAKVRFESGSSTYKWEHLNEVNPHEVAESIVLRLLATRTYDAYCSFQRIKKFYENNTLSTQEVNKMAKLTGFKKIAEISFGGSRKYDYALYDDDVKVGDKVLVTGAAEERLCEVTGVVDVTETTNTDHITAEVIAKVDMSAYEKRVVDRQRKAELVKMMDKKIAEAKEVDKYREYAKLLGGEFAELFDEFSKLS